MKNITDEILNKYLDGELNSKELSELKELVENNPDARKKLKAHKYLDELLREIEATPAPSNFTKTIMSKIVAGGKKRIRTSYFFLSTITLFSIGLISILVLLIMNAKPDGQDSAAYGIYKYIEDFVLNKIQNLDVGIGSSNILFLGGFLTLILLVSAVFMVESHKSFKQKLDNNYR